MPAELPGLWDATLQAMKDAPDGSLVFTNFEDFDMYYGHRRDIKGYAQALEYFDSRLPDILPLLKEDDVVFITADHGNDPAFKGTDHTREQVPVLMFGKTSVPAIWDNVTPMPTSDKQRQTFWTSRP